MGNSFIFPAPRCSYTNATLAPFYHPIPVVENYYSSKAGGPITTVKRTFPSLYLRSSVKCDYLMIYFHGNAEDLGLTCPQVIEFYEHFQV